MTTVFVDSLVAIVQYVIVKMNELNGNESEHKLCMQDIEMIMKYAVDKNMCVFPEQQTFDCCDCTICRIEYKRRLIEKNRK